MLTDAILHVLYTSARGRFFMMPVFILGPFIALRGNHRCLRLLAILLAVPLGIIFGIANLVAGPQLLAALIHRYGAEGQATVTGSFDAGNSYNDRRVMGHNVMIKTADAQTIETSFADDDFNVCPPQNGVYYRQEGDVFNVSYIERLPRRPLEPQAAIRPRQLSFGSLIHSQLDTIDDPMAVYISSHISNPP
jgi:hypothetical protein